MLLTDALLLDYKRCRRRAFLDIYGDPTEQDLPSDFLLKLQQKSRDHKQQILATVPHHSPRYPRTDWHAAAQATLKLMQQGTEYISGGVLLMPTGDGVTLLCFPDLLVKQPGRSNFGDWIYVPTTIKLSKRPKPEYKILTAFRAQLLAAVQGHWPTTGSLILRNQKCYTVVIERWVPLMEQLLSECIETLLQRQEPEVFISRQRCSLCCWYHSCYAIAKSVEHISLLPGVTPSRYRDLEALGVTTIESLATSTITELEPSFGSSVAFQLVQQAQSQVQNRVLLYPKHYFSILEYEQLERGNGNAKISADLPNQDSLPTASVELYFDIEAQPDLPLEYLLGVLVIDRRTETETFHNLFAEHSWQEGFIWLQFLDLVERYPDAPIFHFSKYEVDTVKRLATLYQTPRQIVKPLLNRFVDVHQIVIDTVTMPVESYSLKNLARCLGFEWRDPDMTGSQSVCLYDQWLQTGNHSILEMIQRYNEDDCRATYHLKEWLVNFLSNTLSNTLPNTLPNTINFQNLA
ncbi:MAG: TM0106 family RecB-like putative nuclease [Moorea sp. SIO1G6]|uniref:RecB family nuclease, putative, TM0106 family n=2 Tax=Coleofasciculaceae TaxID=1892251 RepID=F4XI34_9CYAN|nr:MULTISPECIES: TM0106 family RecB-like putative nuclease [unclassified Moorena]EGJ35740.1 RecB family nuclease, putative, TM0106 family [Moorena producens 3L]NEP64778.1 TM0106 family RecB-like putative nuclease [Moorena sp. SIO3A5]NER87545.1 TM0106 family RecB-like putative nuclease [Moorena sp. SIO3A2]NEQ04961.1 TM0106 family RecB-like putative nuclease [Moorena sp. SIO4E2]NET63173.1 TM0106 family RecB-like putative nuclease [Moorena sp. SIO1G6]